MSLASSVAPCVLNGHSVCKWHSQYPHSEQFEQKITWVSLYIRLFRLKLSQFFRTYIKHLQGCLLVALCMTTKLFWLCYKEILKAYCFKQKNCFLNKKLIFSCKKKLSFDYFFLSVKFLCENKYLSVYIIMNMKTS